MGVGDFGAFIRARWPPWPRPGAASVPPARMWTLRSPPAAPGQLRAGEEGAPTCTRRPLSTRSVATGSPQGIPRTVPSLKILKKQMFFKDFQYALWTSLGVLGLSPVRSRPPPGAGSRALPGASGVVQVDTHLHLRASQCSKMDRPKWRRVAPHAFPCMRWQERSLRISPDRPHT